MKAKTRRKIVLAKASLESRLAAAVVINEGGPLMGGKPGYELSEKARANPWGGIGALHRFALKLKLPDRINNALHLLKLHVPYHESDHVLNIAYNLLCSGRTLDDIEHRRQCQAYLDTLGPEEALFSGDVIGGAYGGDARHEAAFSPRGSPEPNVPRLGRAAFARAQRVDARRRTRR